jgi:acetyltransferase-like isoleucine patch superfamily enzyme
VKKSNVEDYLTIADCEIGKRVKIMEPVNIYGCKIGEGSFIGPFVEIQKGVNIGENTRISSHTFICEGVTIGNGVFVAHGVMFVNDKFIDNNKMRKTIIEDEVKIGSGAVILPVKIGKGAVIGAGSIVTKNIPENAVVSGNPAEFKYRRGN